MRILPLLLTSATLTDFDLNLSAVYEYENPSAEAK